MTADGGGNAGLWVPCKSKPGFCPAPTALGNRKRRDSHIPTATTAVSRIFKTKNRQKNCGRWKSGNRKARFPLSHRPDRLRRKDELVDGVLQAPADPKPRKETSQSDRSFFRLILQ